MVAHVTGAAHATKQMLGTSEYTYTRDMGARERLITKEIIIGTHAPRAVGLTIGLPPHLHLLPRESYGRADAREPHMPTAFLRDKPPEAIPVLFPDFHRSRIQRGEFLSSRYLLFTS